MSVKNTENSVAKRNKKIQTKKMAYPCISCFELVESVKLRKYVRFVETKIEDLPKEALLDAFYKIQRCQCCRRHQTRRPYSPFDESPPAPPQTHSISYLCDCPCRYLLRSIVEKLRL